MTLLIKNGGYAFLIRLDLMLSMSLWKEIQSLQIDPIVKRPNYQIFNWINLISKWCKTLKI